MVVAGGVEGEFAEEFADCGDDADLEVVDEDVVAGVTAADADVVASAVVSMVMVPSVSIVS